MRTPLVIAMWEPMAKALGYPRKQLGFDDILKLARSKAGLGRLRAPRVRRVQARPHEPGLLDVRAVGGRRRVLRRDRQEGGPAAGGRDRQGAQDRPGHRALDRPLRRHDAVHRRPAAQERARLRVGGRDGGGDARRLQRANAAASRKLVAIYPTEGTFFSDNPFIVLNARGCTPSRRRARSASSGSWRRRSRPRSRPDDGFRPADLKAKPGRPAHGGQRRRPGAARARARRCPSRACSRCSRRPGARIASPPTSCSCSTRRAR